MTVKAKEDRCTGRFCSMYSRGQCWAVHPSRGAASGVKCHLVARIEDIKTELAYYEKQLEKR